MEYTSIQIKLNIIIDSKGSYLWNLFEVLSHVVKEGQIRNSSIFAMRNIDFKTLQFLAFFSPFCLVKYTLLYKVDYDWLWFVHTFQQYLNYLTGKLGKTGSTAKTVQLPVDCDWNIEINKKQSGYLFHFCLMHFQAFDLSAEGPSISTNSLSNPNDIRVEPSIVCSTAF